jgi:glycerol uptake facilitator-like aquaporin
MKIQPLLAEFLGTFFFCFAGIAAILSATPAVGSGAGIVGIALAHGLALSVAVNAFGGISGAHFNPAVSLGFFITGRLPLFSLGPYIAVQLLGAMTAALICRMLFPAEAVIQAQLGLPLPAVWATPMAVMLGEFVMTFLLMTAIFGTAVDARGQGV